MDQAEMLSKSCSNFGVSEQLLGFDWAHSGLIHSIAFLQWDSFNKLEF